MHWDIVSVTLAVGSAPWQKTLALSLQQAGMLRRILSSGPYLEIQDCNGEGTLQKIGGYPLYHLANRLMWGVWKRLPGNWHVQSPVMATAALGDALSSRWIPQCGVFHGWMGHSLASLRVAKRQGAVTLLENPGRHPGHFHRAPEEECDRFNIKQSDRSSLLPTALIHRIEREYEISDRIVVPSTLAYRSFTKSGYAGKTVVAFPGVDHQFFSPFPSPQTARASLFRVCFAGRVELAKGAGYLLQAWKRLALSNAELVLAGEVRPEMKALLQTLADSTVRTTGFLPTEDLLQLYRVSDLFVLPSVNEGLAQVLLEAMAAALPVVASDMSGADDCVTQGIEGFITTSRDVDSLAKAILWCYQHRDEARAMGRAARTRIESQFTLAHYNQRMIALYRCLAGAST